MGNNKFDSSDLGRLGDEVLDPLDENASEDLSVMNELEKRIENKNIRISVNRAEKTFSDDINSITKGTARDFATAPLEDSVNIPGLTSKIGSLTIAFAMMSVNS